MTAVRANRAGSGTGVSEPVPVRPAITPENRHQAVTVVTR